MRSNDAILGRLDGLHLAYLVTSDNTQDKELQAMISTLEWVLEDDPEDEP